MGELQGLRNAWAYVEGGMGSVSQSIARAAESLGATLVTEAVSWLCHVQAYCPCRVLSAASSGSL